MSVRVRFAPSPTGKLHVGNIRTLLANVLFARRNKGKVIIRMEDTDLGREVEGAEARMFETIEWLGLNPDESPVHGGKYGPYRTQERAERGDYDKALKKLLKDGRAYECFVSKTELELMRKIQVSSGQPPRYDNRHRALSDEEKAKFRAEGRTPVIRFRLEDEAEVIFEDLVRGTVKFETGNLGGDPVIIRENGVPIFAFAGAVDDINQKITHVVRGEDHVTNTAIQVQIFKALGADIPVFAHMPLLANEDGSKLSKRLDSLSIEALKTQGFVASAILSYLAALGFSHPVEVGSLDVLAEKFDFSQMGRAPARFGLDQLKRVNAMALRNMGYKEIQPQLAAFIASAKPKDATMEAFWLAIRENIETLADAAAMHTLCFTPPSPPTMGNDDIAFIRAAEQALPAGPYDGKTWEKWVGALKEETGRKGKALFMPLRLALTGQEHGPELANLLPVIGEEAARLRLKAVCTAAA